MKKPYQIQAQRAVQPLEQMASEGNPAVQMILPMAEVVGWLREGVGKGWHSGDQRVRWVSSGLIVAERQFRRVMGYRQIPALVTAMDALVPSKKVVAKKRRAS